MGYQLYNWMKKLLGKPSKIRKAKIEPWITPISNGDLVIIETSWASGNPWVFDDQGDIIILDGSDGYSPTLLIRLLHIPSRTLYRVTFKDADLFRVIDRVHHTNSSEARTNTFRMSNHLWQREFPLSFDASVDGSSWCISSNVECIEVLASDEPAFTVERIVESEPRSKHNKLVQEFLKHQAHQIHCR